MTSCTTSPWGETRRAALPPGDPIRTLKPSNPETVTHMAIRFNNSGPDPDDILYDQPLG